MFGKDILKKPGKTRFTFFLTPLGTWDIFHCLVCACMEQILKKCFEKIKSQVGQHMNYLLLRFNLLLEQQY